MEVVDRQTPDRPPLYPDGISVHHSARKQQCNEEDRYHRRCSEVKIALNVSELAAIIDPINQRSTTDR
jgi:hypothetical protein